MRVGGDIRWCDGACVTVDGVVRISHEEQHSAPQTEEPPLREGGDASSTALDTGLKGDG